MTAMKAVTRIGLTEPAVCNAFFLTSIFSCPSLVASEEAMSLGVHSKTQAVYSPCSMKEFLTVMASSAPASPPSTGASKWQPPPPLPPLGDWLPCARAS